MDSEKKIKQLKGDIEEKLTPLVNHDYRYLMMCDHKNVGDSFIMLGEFAFLSTIKKYKCKEYTTMLSFEKRHSCIPKDDLLIMRGSGSFGDVWPTAPKFWRFVFEKYPENPILFMPQTIHFDKQDNLLAMAEMINNHKKVVICVRDSMSYEIGKKYFQCPIYLVPDMAFYMEYGKYIKQQALPHREKVLLVRRDDKESKRLPVEINLMREVNPDVSDWPTFAIHDRIDQIKECLLSRHLYKMYDFYIKHVCTPHNVKIGLKFLTPYSVVYATRMHAGILSMMMGKRVVFLDNSYGKLSRVCETWLSDVDSVKIEK